MNKILLVCTGNTCRSCMAEGLFKKYIKEAGLDSEYQISSAGTSVFIQSGANPNAITAMRAKEIDVSAHKSRQITSAMLIESEYVVAMTNAHKQTLIKMCPQCREKIYTLKELADGNQQSDISDPFGCSTEDYINCANQIECCVKKIVDVLDRKNFNINT